MHADDAPVAVALFARPPVAGATKTRLIPALGAQGAANFHAACLQELLQRCLDCLDGEVRVYSASEARHPALLASIEGFDVATRAQASGHLGVRMASALADGIDRYGRALVVGTDVPTLPAPLLQHAAAALRETAVVIGPSTDGGYYLIGASNEVPPLFEGIEWSTDKVLAQTLRRARQHGVRVTLLPSWDDIDTPEDLAALREELRHRPDNAPRVAAFLRNHDALF